MLSSEGEVLAAALRALDALPERACESGVTSRLAALFRTALDAIAPGHPARDGLERVLRLHAWTGTQFSGVPVDVASLGRGVLKVIKGLAPWQPPDSDSELESSGRSGSQ